MALIRHIRSLEEHNDLLEAKKDAVVVYDFHASWCGPCHQIAPVFEQLSQKYNNIAFAKVDVDAVTDVAAMYSVSSIPTFLVVKNKTVVDQLRGADPVALRSMVQKHTGAGGEEPSTSSGEISLLEFVDLTQVNCLNEASPNTIKSIIHQKRANTDKNYFLLSDADEQLIINITFNQTVRVRSLMLKSLDAQQGPKDVKLMINNSSAGFDDFETATEPAVAQAIQFSEDDVREGKAVNLRFVRFQSVKVLSIFIASNHGDSEQTRIDAVDISGLPVQTTKDLSGLKRQEE